MSRKKHPAYVSKNRDRERTAEQNQHMNTAEEIVRKETMEDSTAGYYFTDLLVYHIPKICVAMIWNMHVLHRIVLREPLKQRGMMKTENQIKEHAGMAIKCDISVSSSGR